MRLFGMAFVTAAVVLGGAAPVRAQQAPAAPAAPAQPNRAFNQDGGIVLHYILADKAADFELSMQKVKEALHKSTNPERQRQAASWKVYKAGPGPTGTVLYAFVIDPSVKNAEYSLGAILLEGLGEDGRAIYQTYADSYPKTGPSQVVINLELLSDFGK